MISNIAFTEKSEKLCQTSEIQEIQGAILNKVTLDIDVFTDEPVVEYDAQVAENTFPNKRYK